MRKRSDGVQSSKTLHDQWSGNEQTNRQKWWNKNIKILLIPIQYLQLTLIFLFGMCGTNERYNRLWFIIVFVSAKWRAIDRWQCTNISMDYKQLFVDSDVVVVTFRFFCNRNECFVNRQRIFIVRFNVNIFTCIYI